MHDKIALTRVASKCLFMARAGGTAAACRFDSRVHDVFVVLAYRLHVLSEVEAAVKEFVANEL